MRTRWHKFIENFRQPSYPELLPIVVISAMLSVFQPSMLHWLLSGFILVVALLLGVFSYFRPHHTLIPVTILGLLALTLGLLNFNYIPSLVVWMLIFTRLILVKKQHTLSIMMLTLLAVVVSLLTANFLLPKLTLTAYQQTALNIVALLSVIVSITLHLWRLLQIVQHYQRNLAQSQQRLTSLVTMTNRLTRYLPPKVWQPILKNQNSVEIVSQRRKMTILFSDIVGFTDLSDTISPDHLANILNTYFDRMTQITLNYGATLDKFIGDGMLCYFGDEPHSNERENALKCVRMAIDMRREMAVLRRQWQSQGFDGLHVRIGINTGYCYVGNFGSRNRMTYTVIGKEANFAARLEATAQKDQILISESTYNLVHQKYPCEAVGEIRLKGLQAMAKVWQVLEPEQNASTVQDWVDYHLPGFNLHLNFQDIRNYDRQVIVKKLTEAVDLLQQDKP